MRGAVVGRFGDLDAAARLLASRKLDTTIATDPLLLSLFADCAVMTRDQRWAEALLEPLSKHRGLALSWGVFGLIWDGPAEQWLGSLLAVLERWEEAARSNLSWELTGLRNNRICA